MSDCCEVESNVASVITYSRLFICTDALRRNPATSRVLDSEIERCVKDWLPFALDRERRRQPRAAQKATIGAMQTLAD